MTIPTMEKDMKKTKLPQTDSIEELAKFWQTHDITDFENELEEVTEPVFERSYEPGVRIHLQLQEWERVKRIAKSKGLDDASLIREWVLERLQTAQT